jgi:hypothetical protein
MKEVMSRRCEARSESALFGGTLLRWASRLTVSGWKVGLSFWVAGVAVATGAVPLSEASTRGVVVPLYLAGQAETAAVVRIGTLRKDHERRGFFHIRLLPMVVAEDVVIEFRNTADATGLLAKVPTHLQAKTTRGTLEMRRVTLKLAGEATARLEADHVRVTSPARWDLAGDVRCQIGLSQWHARSGLLTVAGPGAGRLRLPNQEQALTLQLFSNSSAFNPSINGTESP